MAMMQCPECGQEVSDKARKCIYCGKILKEEKAPTKLCKECGKEVPADAVECPYCGFPLEECDKSEELLNMAKRKKRIAIPIIIIAAATIIAGIVYGVKVVKPRNTYAEAIALLEKGKYEEANDLLYTIQGYSDVDIIQEQLKYESYAYSAINSLKEYLKNPDSYQPYEITFYVQMNDNEEKTADIQSESEDEREKETMPVCIMHYGAQNGFGGNTTGYAFCTYNSELNEYELLGTCDSLDEDDYDRKDLDEMFELLICEVITNYRDKGELIGDIDLGRLKTVLKNDAYSTVKIIE